MATLFRYDGWAVPHPSLLCSRGRRVDVTGKFPFPVTKVVTVLRPVKTKNSNRG